MSVTPDAGPLTAPRPAFFQLQKLLQMRRKVVSEEEQRDSGSEQRGDEDDIPLGPQSNISLLDQHQHLKEKAEGMGVAGRRARWLLGGIETSSLFS